MFAGHFRGSVRLLARDYDRIVQYLAVPERDFHCQ
jgi:hypothetical protein